MTSENEKTLILATLVFPVRGDEVMLAEKTRKIGAGYLNGWGGGVEGGESLRLCAKREFFEETGGVYIEESDLNKVAVVNFKNNKSDGMSFVCSVHVYTVNKWQGEIVSTEEMKNPKWYKISDIPKLNLMPADQFWLQRVLSGDTGIASAEYEPFQKSLIGEVLFESKILSSED